MNVWTTVLAAVLVTCSAGSAASQGVKVQFHDGTVSLSAQNAPLRTILAEWARVGGATIVNADRVTGDTLTLELTSVSERQAISVLLRNVSGYIVAPRRGGAPGASSIGRIVILPPSTAVASTAPRPPASAPPPIVFTPGDPEEDPITDIPPNGFPRTVPSNTVDVDIQRELREAAARAAAAQDVDEPADVPTPDSSQPARSRSGRTPQVQPNPFFGNVPSSSQPGSVNRDSPDDDDPDR